jgi:hypothetical protein
MWGDSGASGYNKAINYNSTAILFELIYMKNAKIYNSISTLKIQQG